MTETVSDRSRWSVVALGIVLLLAAGSLAGCLGGSDDGAPGADDGTAGDGGAEDGQPDGDGSGGSGTAGDWPMHGLDAGNTAAFGSPGDGQGTVLWESTSTDTQSSPAIANGLVYVGEENGVSAWDVETGEQAWWFEDNATPEEVDEGRARELSTPVVLDGTVFVASTLLNYPARVLALDADTGEEAWRVELDAGLRASPTVADGLVYFGTERIQGSGHAAVHAVDADSGDQEWTFDVGENPVVYGSPIFDDGSVFFGTTGGIAPTGTGDHLYRLEAETGEEEWRTEFPGTSSSVAIGDGTVFVESGEEVLAYDEATGDEVWTYEDVEETRADPTFADGTVYIADEEAEELVALDAGTGEETWTFEAAATPPAVAGETVYTTAIDDGGNATVHALEASTGDEDWAADLGPADAVMPPAFADGTLVVTQDDFPEATIFALDA